MASSIVGAAGVLIASLFWGSNFIICKGYNLPSDGMCFISLMSTGIILVGILTLFSSAIKQDGDFEAIFSPEGLAGGAIWATGNFLTVPTLQNAGLGVGMATWCVVNLIVAFIIGAVGMGSILPKENLDQPAVGATGIMLAVASLVLFANVSPSLSAEESREGNGVHPLPPPGEVAGEDSDSEAEAKSESSSGRIVTVDINEAPNFLDEEISENPKQQREGGNILLGVGLGTIMGVFFGFQFVPLSVWNKKIEKLGETSDHERPSDVLQALHFFFSQFAGIFLTSLLGFIVYCLWTRNRPRLVPSEATLPSVASGITWALGCAGAMLGTSGLGNAVGFVLCLCGTILVSSSWSILYFKEIRGQRNLLMFGSAFLLMVVGSVLISLSKG